MQRAGGRGCSQQDLLTCQPPCCSKSHHGHQVFLSQAALNAIPSPVWVPGPPAPQIGAVCFFFFRWRTRRCKTQILFGSGGESPHCNGLSEWELRKAAIGKKEEKKKKKVVSFQQGKSVSLEQQDVFCKHEATAAVRDRSAALKRFILSRLKWSEKAGAAGWALPPPHAAKIPPRRAKPFYFNGSSFSKGQVFL